MSGIEGATLNHYKLIEQIGQGGMASVFRAKDLERQAIVAVKVLSPLISADARFVRRFRREAEYVSRLNHPNIIPVLDYGEHRGFVYLVMPHIPGTTLKIRLAEGTVRLEDAERWIHQIADALDYAHRMGILHRDVKPSNILIDAAGDARLTDFGLAKLIGGSSSLTGSSLMGTPAYISPEQARGDEVDPRSDQYSLGVLLYEIHTGRLPFTAETPMNLAMKHATDPVPPPSRVHSEVPAGIERVILTALQKDPAHRFASMAAMRDAYLAALAGDPLHALSATQTAIGRSAGRRFLLRRSVWADRSTQGFALTLLALALILVAALNWPALAARFPALADVFGLTAAESTPESIPVAGAATLLPAPTSTSPPTASPRIVSEACPGLSIFGFNVEGEQTRWLLDNQTGLALRLINLRDFRGPPTEQRLVAILLGDEVVFQGDSSAGDQGWREGADRAIEAGAITPLTFRFDWQAAPTGYAFTLEFDNDCSISGTW